MARYFTLEQAQELIPGLEQEIREAIRLKQDYAKAEGELQANVQRIMLLGGILPDRQRMAALKSQREKAAERLKSILENIQGLGVEVKDLDIGLLDFPTLFRGEEVYLCWKLGEQRIEYWHGLQEGYRGRKVIDQDFLDHHEGDKAQ